MTELAVVITAGPGRESNLELVLAQLDALEHGRGRTVAVLDGVMEYGAPLEILAPDHVRFVRLRKHAPGMQQPRNVGVRIARSLWPGITHVHFLDSDIILDPDAPAALSSAIALDPQDAIVIGPYDWLRPGLRPLAGGDVGFIGEARSEQGHVMHDVRWPMFRQHEPGEVFHGDLSVGLACFGGNLVWNVERFTGCGGFWNDLYHGRCEDGELGVRAVAMDVPIRLAREARGYHLFHETNDALKVERNVRDVAMLDARHPWIHDHGVELVVDRDGAAFDILCDRCGQMVQTGLMWDHFETCRLLGESR